MQAQIVKQRYILIGGFGPESKGLPKTISLYEGNVYGERLVKTLRVLFDKDGTYENVCKLARELAQKLKVRVGRNFSADEWAGKVIAQ